MYMVGDMNKFAQFQSATALEAASNNPGGSAGAGIGIGAGIGLGNMMAQNMMNTQAQTAPAAAVPVQTKEDIMKMLKDLGDLKTAGILTEEEFTAKKTELLAKL